MVLSGGVLAKKWNLPESLTQAISYHHHPSLSTGYSGLAAITGFANYLCHNNNAEDKTSLPPPQLLKDHMETLHTIFDNFTLNSIEDSLEDVRNILTEKADIFSIIS